MGPNIKGSQSTEKIDDPPSKKKKKRKKKVSGVWSSATKANNKREPENCRGSPELEGSSRVSDPNRIIDAGSVCEGWEKKKKKVYFRTYGWGNKRSGRDDKRLAEGFTAERKWSQSIHIRDPPPKKRKFYPLKKETFYLLLRILHIP